MQREYTEKCDIFEAHGEVMEAGWAKSRVFEYNPSQSKTKGRHGQRHCWFVNNGEVSLYLSVESILQRFSVKIAVADLKKGGVISDCLIKRLFLSKRDLPGENPVGEFLYNDKKLQLQITNTVDGVLLKCDYIDFGGFKNMYFNISLKRIALDSLDQLAPFERDRRYFYLKRFEPCFIASGMLRVGGIEYSLNENTSRAYYDLARYSKPRKHNYQRLSSDCVIGGQRISLCLAGRVGDNRYGNENSLFINGRLEKLSQINVKSTNGRLDRPWYFTAGFSAVDIYFKPFTIKGQPMTAEMDKTTVLFGRLYGHINRTGFDKPLILDNAQAHMIFSEF